MNADAIRNLFDSVFGSEGTGLATAPLLMLGAGVLLLLVAEVFPTLHRARPWIFLGTLAAAAIGSITLLGADAAPGTVLGGTFHADATTAVWNLIFLAATGLAWAYSRSYYGDDDERFKSEHDLLMLVTPLGMMMMAGARDLIVFFIGLELLSIPLYVLAAFRRARTRSVEAGLKYFLLGAFSSGFFLYGASLLYAGTGSISLGELAETGIEGPLAIAGVALLASSLFFKISVFPFHLWVPDVYEGSPTPVTVLMATGTKAAAFGFLLPAAVLLPVEAAGTIAAIALITMLLGNLGALVQTDLKRLLAYSGIAHAGTLLLVVAGALAGDGLSAEATRAALFYMAAYVVTAAGAFGIVAWLESEDPERTKLENLRGLARTRPRTAAALSLFMLSLGGIPATGGFLGKWFVFSVLVQAEWIGVAILGALMSVVALGYYLRVIIIMTMQDAPEEGGIPAAVAPRPARIATALCVVGVLVLGLAPGTLLNWLS